MTIYIELICCFPVSNRNFTGFNSKTTPTFPIDHKRRMISINNEPLEPFTFQFRHLADRSTENLTPLNQSWPSWCPKKHNASFGSSDHDLLLRIKSPPNWRRLNTKSKWGIPSWNPKETCACNNYHNVVNHHSQQNLDVCPSCVASTGPPSPLLDGKSELAGRQTRPHHLILFKLVFSLPYRFINNNWLLHLKQPCSILNSKLFHSQTIPRNRRQISSCNKIQLTRISLNSISDLPSHCPTYRWLEDTETICLVPAIKTLFIHLCKFPSNKYNTHQ